MPYVNHSRRKAIIKRNSRAAAQIEVSEIKNVGELCFVLAYLFAHYAYKRSKTDGLKFQTLAEIAGAVKVAYDEFNRTVVAPKEFNALDENGRITDADVRTNPYSYL